VGIADAYSVADAIVEADVGGVRERGDRRFDELGHLAGVGPEFRPHIGDADEWLHEEVGDDYPERRHRADEAHVPRVNADFLMCLAERAGGWVLARIERTAGKADLAGMMRQIVVTHGERKRRAVLARIQKDQRRRPAS